MKNFKKLEIWKLGMHIASNSFKITEEFSTFHKWGIGIQINKCGVSIPSNIAEGCSRRSEKDQYRFIEIAQGSSFEIETQLLLTKNMSSGNIQLIEETLNLVIQEQKMIMSYMERLNI
jgi:four helix bundle protein